MPLWQDWVCLSSQSVYSPFRSPCSWNTLEALSSSTHEDPGCNILPKAKAQATNLSPLSGWVTSTVHLSSSGALLCLVIGSSSRLCRLNAGTCCSPLAMWSRSPRQACLAWIAFRTLGSLALSEIQSSCCSERESRQAGTPSRGRRTGTSASCLDH